MGGSKGREGVDPGGTEGSEREWKGLVREGGSVGTD